MQILSLYKGRAKTHCNITYNQLVYHIYVNMHIYAYIYMYT